MELYNDLLTCFFMISINKIIFASLLSINIYKTIESNPPINKTEKLDKSVSVNMYDGRDAKIDLYIYGKKSRICEKYPYLNKRPV